MPLDVTPWISLPRLTVAILARRAGRDVLGVRVPMFVMWGAA